MSDGRAEFYQSLLGKGDGTEWDETTDVEYLEEEGIHGVEIVKVVEEETDSPKNVGSGEGSQGGQDEPVSNLSSVDEDWTMSDVNDAIPHANFESDIFQMDIDDDIIMTDSENLDEHLESQELLISDELRSACSEDIDMDRGVIVECQPYSYSEFKGLADFPEFHDHQSEAHVKYLLGFAS